MFEIALYLLASIQPQSNIQFMDLEGLSPQAIGNLLLNDAENAEIFKVERQKGHLQPPGFAYLYLYEQPKRLKPGCQRKRWQATFHLGLKGMRGNPGLQNIYATEQVAISDTIPCEFAEYTSVGSGLTAASALNALGRLYAIRENEKWPTIDCSDTTESKLCRSTEYIRKSLQSIKPWFVKREGSHTIFWFKAGGSTEVVLSDHEGDPIVVSRRIPPPF